MRLGKGETKKGVEEGRKRVVERNPNIGKPEKKKARIHNEGKITPALRKDEAVGVELKRITPRKQCRVCVFADYIVTRQQRI